MCDDRGRLYLPKCVREKYGDRFYFVEMDGEIRLVPKPTHPLKELEELGKLLPKRKIWELKKEIQEEAEKEVEEKLDVRRH